jgi:hypothetical protein
MIKRWAHRALMVAAAAIFLTTGCESTTRTEAQSTSDQSWATAESVSDSSSEEMPNPFVDYDTLEEAEKAVGFDISIPESVTVNGKEYAEKNYQVATDLSLIQVFYMDNEDLPVLMIRKASGTEDISGDYNEYAITKSVSDVFESEGSSVEVKIKGNSNDAMCLATWVKDGYSYAVSLEDSIITEDEMLDIVSQVSV